MREIVVFSLTIVAAALMLPSPLYRSVSTSTTSAAMPSNNGVAEAGWPSPRMQSLSPSQSPSATPHAVQWVGATSYQMLPSPRRSASSTPPSAVDKIQYLGSASKDGSFFPRRELQITLAPTPSSTVTSSISPSALETPSPSSSIGYTAERTPAPPGAPPIPSGAPLYPCFPSPCPGVSVVQYSGDYMLYTVPSSVQIIWVELWGASIIYPGQASQGSGAYVAGYLPTTPGETLQLLVGGSNNGTAGGFGGGGEGGADTGTIWVDFGGAGRSAIQRSSSSTGFVDIVSAGGASFNNPGEACCPGTTGGFCSSSCWISCSGGPAGQSGYSCPAGASEGCNGGGGGYCGGVIGGGTSNVSGLCTISFAVGVVPAVAAQIIVREWPETASYRISVCLRGPRT